MASRLVILATPQVTPIMASGQEHFAGGRTLLDHRGDQQLLTIEKLLLHWPQSRIVGIVQEQRTLRRKALLRRLFAQVPDIGSERYMNAAPAGEAGEKFGGGIVLQVVVRPVALVAAHHRRKCGELAPSLHQFCGADVAQQARICAVAAGSAAWLSEHYGFPMMLLGLLIGLSLNFITRDPQTHRGLDFASRTCLRVGIIALGLQVTFEEIRQLGWPAFAALLAIMAVTIAAGMGGARLFGQSRYSGLLAGGATAICVASAALALYGMIGRDRLSQAQFALTLVGISMASALAMSVYPALAAELHFSDEQAGFLVGASIHDAAQAIGGGYAFSNEAGTYATIVKLSRVAMLAPIVLIAGIWLNAQRDKSAGIAVWRRISVPGFIILFLLVLCANSFLHIPDAMRTAALTGSKALLLLAVTATAMRSRMDLLMELGWRAVGPVIVASVVSLIASLAIAFVVI